MEEFILHYGIKRKSGRYPWGSGEEPFQSQGSFLSQYQTLREEGRTETQIANELGLTTTQLRNAITYARKEEREYNRERVAGMKEEGLSNVEIGQRLGISEGTVRNYISDNTSSKATSEQQLDNIEKALSDSLKQTGHLDVGVGVERQLGVSRTKFNAVVNQMVENGDLYIHNIQIQRLNDPTKYTTVKVLSTEPEYLKVLKDSTNIGNLEYFSDDKALVSAQRFETPQMVDLNRIKIRYQEDGGSDLDGLIEIRKGSEDLDLGNSRYAQVRIGAGEDLYLKGMAAYTDSDFPKGVDIIFNTNKPKGTPVESVLKKMDANPKDTGNPETLFGTNLRHQRNALNIVNEEGTWDTWSKNMSSQFLSKQPINLIRERLEATFDGLKKEYNELSNLNNPIVKGYLLGKFEEGLDSKARMLAAKGLAGTKNHVLLPIPDMKPNEIYAPNYNNGDRVVLVRHPHGGIFEIPDLIVNNKVPRARDIIGSDAPDAVGIHPTVAQKLSGADFDGDTVLVIPNNSGSIKSGRSLKELKNFDPMTYKVDRQTMTPFVKGLQMGVVSNLITDMTIKGANNSEIARAVRHSMVVIDAEKHNLDYKKSARDNGIAALRSKYQTRTDPESGKTGIGASTLISRAKNKIDLSNPDFKVDSYSSGTAREKQYVNFVKGLQSLKNESKKQISSIKNPTYNKVAKEVYEPEVKSLNKKLNTALLNAPRERQAQILTNALYYQNIQEGMDKDDRKKLKSRSLAQARVTTGTKRQIVDITDNEWEAIQAGAVSNTKVKQILDNADLDRVRALATPRPIAMTSAKASRAQALLDRGLTYAEVSQALGVSAATIREAIK